MIVGLASRVEAFVARPYPTQSDLKEHFEVARSEGYRSVVVPSSFLESACELVEGTEVKIACAIGFPFGTIDADVKRFETDVAVDLGAHEIELVPSIPNFISLNYKTVLREIRDVVEAADERPVKVVIESHLWTEEHLAKVIETVLESGAQFVSTTIALQGRHASAEAVRHLRELAGPEFGIKVSGFKTLEGAEEIIAAGADRIGLAL